jgi:transposase
MFIRRTNTRNRTTGEPYFTYRLVDAIRMGKAVRQRTLLNLGSRFDLPQDQWPALAVRIEQILRGQATLLAQDLSEQAESLAQRYAAQLLARAPAPSAGATASAAGDAHADTSRYAEIDLDSVESVRPRSVGVEHVALAAIGQLGFDGKLAELGFSKPQLAAALGNIIARMAVPGSELATYAWLQQRSALGELRGYDYEGMALQRLYRSADQLLQHRDALEAHLFGASKSLFGLSETVTLYDLTNTYFEGTAAGIGKARRGHSKEKRNDCPLVTLALVLDGSGFPKRSRVFEGNATESKTLGGMLEALGAQPRSCVVMDAGIATEANLLWLKQQGHDYLVVSRRPTRQFDPAQAVQIQTADEQTIQVQRVLDADIGEALLYCYSPARAQKDLAIDTKLAEGFEAALKKMAAGLAKPRATKDPHRLHERIGRAKQKYARAARHYRIELAVNEASKKATALTWERLPLAGTSATHPGVYCLRTTLSEPGEAELWHIYSMLTELEAVFRSLKSDLGLRPVHHQIDRRVEAHLFISVLAYYFVHTLRLQLKACGIHDSWQSLRNTLSTQVRITTTLQQRDARTVHVRKASRPEPAQHSLYAALKLAPNPGGTHRSLV